jgi:hypothetical protein
MIISKDLFPECIRCKLRAADLFYSDSNGRFFEKDRDLPV